MLARQFGQRLIRQHFGSTASLAKSSDYGAGEGKTQAVALASAKFDTLKVYLRLAVHEHCLEEKVYLKIFPHLGTIGTMLGGWLRETNKSQPKT